MANDTPSSDPRRAIIEHTRTDLSVFLANLAADRGLSMNEIAVIAAEESATWARHALDAERATSAMLKAQDGRQ